MNDKAVAHSHNHYHYHFHLNIHQSSEIIGGVGVNVAQIEGL